MSLGTVESHGVPGMGMAQPAAIATTAATATTAVDLTAPIATAMATSTAPSTVGFPSSATSEPIAGHRLDSADSLLEELGFSGMGSLSDEPPVSSVVVGQPLSDDVMASVPAHTNAQADSGSAAEVQSVFGEDEDSLLLYDGGAGQSSGLPRSGSWPNMDMLAAGDAYDLGLLPDMLGPSGASIDGASSAVEVGGAGMPRNGSLDLNLNFGE